MKKLLCLLFSVLMLCACGEKKWKSGELLYKTCDYEEINNLDEKKPDSIEFHSDEYGVGYTFTEEEDINDLVTAFKEIKLSDKVDSLEGLGNEIIFNFGDNYYDLYICDGVLMIFAEDGEEYYQLENYQTLIDLGMAKLIDIFELDVTYVDLAEYEGVKLSVGKVEEDVSGNYYIEIAVENNSDIDYAFVLNTRVNGFFLYNYTQLGVMAGSDTGYVLPVQTSCLNDFGIKDLGEIEIGAYIYCYDSSTFTLGELLYTSDYVSFKNDKYNIMDKDVNKEPVIYSQDDISVCSVLTYGETYDSISFYVEGEFVDHDYLVIKDLVVNGQLMETYEFDVPASNEMFIKLPLANYDYNQETGEVTKIELETLSLSIDFVRNDSVTSSGKLNIIK